MRHNQTLLSCGVVAPRQAGRLWPGERPGRVRASHPPVARRASMAESWGRTRRTRGATRRPRLLEAVGVTAPPAGRVPRRETRVADAAGVHAQRRPHTSLCLGAAVQVRRSPPAAAGRPRDGDARGRPPRRRPAGQADAGATAPAPRRPGDGDTRPRERRAPNDRMDLCGPRVTRRTARQPRPRRPPAPGRWQAPAAARARLRQRPHGAAPGT